MIHLRLIVPRPVVATVLAHLDTAPGVAHVVHLPNAARRPEGDVVLCDVAREAANGVIEWLQRRDVHRHGAIVISSSDAVVSDAAQRASDIAPGHGGDALIWEAVEAQAREVTALTPSFLVILSIATMIAGIGIMLDSPILVVGAMVVGPEYGPIVAVCAAAVRRRWRPAAVAASTLVVALSVGAAVALAASSLFRLSGLAPEDYDVSARELTAFISRPDAMAVVVAVLAGVVGMLSVTQARAATLVGVLVSVTTIPAVANVGVATAYGQLHEVRGAALQLTLNLLGMVAAGVMTLAVQSLAAARRQS